MKIDYCFPAKRLSLFMVLVSGESMFLVKGRLPLELQDSLEGDFDVSNSTVQCEIKLSEVISLTVNKNNQDVTVLHGPRGFDSAIAVVSLWVDLASRFDWQVAGMLAVSSFFLLGTLGWLAERLKHPAVIILVEPKTL